ncbi:uncharacterized protein LOC119731825 [Patiria miniata]|uniref:Thioredoxin domain-containing protein n=1 Tax=Patiria miniata TaxID=46514 RepID=A0A914AC30_PATMI|nr:uncharacterized protein LOC119731825 [Patiria miniata]
MKTKMATYMKRLRCRFSVVFLMNLSYICLIIEIGLVSSEEHDKSGEISVDGGIEVLPSENPVQGTERVDSVLPHFETSDELENEKLYDRILKQTLEQIEAHHGEKKAEINLQTQEADVTKQEAPTLSAQDSSVPVDYIQILASYMTPEVFQQFMKSLNKTLDTRIQYTHPDFTYANATENDEAQRRKVKYPCMQRPAGNRTAQVKIVNNTELMELVSAVYSAPGQENSSSALGGYCAFVMFYAPWCKFSAKAAPAFNAIGRAFPDLEVLAVDAFQYNSLNTRYGIVAVPNVLLFHNNKPVMRFNYSQRTFEVFSQFIQNFTGLEPNTSIQVSEVDTLGPLPSVATEETDYALWLSWLLLISVAVWFLEQRLGSAIKDRVRTFVVYARQVWRTGELYDQVGVLVHEHHD